MTAASSSSFLALRTSHGTPAPARAAASSSDSRTLDVPTRTGRPAAWTAAISRTRASRLALPVSEDDVGQVPAHARPVGRHDDDAQAVEFLELSRRGLGRGRHAAERRIEPEEVLERDRAEDAPLGAAPHPLLGLDGGLEAVGPMPLVHDPAGELVDDLDAAVADDVIDVALEQELGVEGAVDRGQELSRSRKRRGCRSRGRTRRGGCPRRSGRRWRSRRPSRSRGPARGPGRRRPAARRRAGSAGGPGDDERDAGFVDEDGVGLVDEGHGERPVDEFAGLVGQPVPQVVEAGLLGGGVRDIAGVGGPLGRPCPGPPGRRRRTGRGAGRPGPSRPRRGGPGNR